MVPMNKPIIIIIASICEAIFYDFYLRIRALSKEGAKNLDSDIIDQIRAENIDKLRKLRNRVHIQNKKKHFEPDENVAFSYKRKIMAEKFPREF